MKPAQPKKHKSPVRCMKEDKGMVVDPRSHEVDDVTAALIERCRSQGLSLVQCSKIVGLNPRTLEKYYEDDYEAGTTSLVTNISKTMASIALDAGNKQCVSAAKFMLGRLAPDIYAERSVVQYLDRNGKAMDANQGGVLDPYSMSEEQREALRSALASVLKDAVDEAADHKVNRDAIEVTAIEYQGDVVSYEDVKK